MIHQQLLEAAPRAATPGPWQPTCKEVEMQDKTNPRPRRERVKTGIYKTALADGQVRFEITYRDTEGRQRWESIEGGIRAAEARRADIQARKWKGERVAPNPRLTFNEAADRWWEAQANRLRPATQRAYRASLEHLRRRFGKMRLDRLGVDELARHIAERQQDAKAWTIKGELTVLSRTFQYAARSLGSGAANPVPLLDPSERPRSDEAEKRVLNQEELRRLLREIDAEYQALFKFAAATGSRLGEVLGLRWNKIDFQRGTATIDHQVDRDGRYVELKTKRSRRTIELPPTLIALLREHKIRSGYSKDHDYVFASRDGSALDNRNVSGRVLRRALARAELGEIKRHDGEVVKHAPTFHSLRHSHASLWIAEGGDIVSLSSRLGHSDPAITARVYAHQIEEAERSQARTEKLEGMYGHALDG